MRAALIALALIALAPVARAETRLLMLETQWCEWCQQWHREVGDAYDRTAEGRQAPLLRQDISAPLPADVTLTRLARYTPTFVLLENGVEIGRIEGYPGEDFFYGLLQELLEKLSAASKGGA